MSGIAPRSEQFADPQLARMQKSVEEATAASRSCALVDGKLIAGVTLGTGATDVSHGLGRAFRGYLVCSLTAAATITVATTQRDPTKFASLIASAPTTATLWVF